MFQYCCSLVGEISALFEVQRLYTLVAATDAEIFIFKKDDLLDFLSLYPVLKATLEQSCLLHYKETVEAAAKSAGVSIIVPITDEGNFIARNNDIEPPINSGDDGSKFQQGTNPSKATPNGVVNEKVEGPTILIHAPSKDLISNDQSSNNESVNVDDMMLDPLRPPLNFDPVEKTDMEEKDYHKRKWLSYLVTYGKLQRDEMGCIHIVQE